MKKKCSSVARVALMILIASFILPGMTFIGTAESGTVYEVESNNTWNTATETYDDYDSYGSITTTSDVDWWTVYFGTEGFANFYLGSIPSGCDYDLQVYNYNGSKVLAESLKGSNKSELVKIHVRPGESYRIKIFSHSGSSTSRYKLRVKRYDLQGAKLFTNDDSEKFKTHYFASSVLSKMRNMGFSAQEYLNCSAATAYNVLPTTDIFVASNMGWPGQISFYNSSLYAKKASSFSYDRFVAEYASGQLGDVKLAIYAAPYAGDVQAYFGCLVDETLSKGAFCSFGWTPEIDVEDLNGWLNAFFNYCENGYNIGRAIDLSNDWADDNAKYPEAITKIYYGSSRLWATVLG